MRRFGAMAAVLLILCSCALAQEFRGKVQGIVSDASDAAMPGVEVTLTSIDTGLTLRATSNATGAYVFDFVPPGNYRLTAVAPGFAKKVQDNLNVPVRAVVEANLTMTVGSSTESVTVTAAAPELKFESASIDTVINEKLIQTLPQEARNPFALAMLEPSVRAGNGMGGGMEPFMVWGGSSISVGGTNQRQGELLVDGAPSKVSTMTGYVPSIDSVQEFTVVQNSADAELGFSSGGVITLATKSGTNEWHGSGSYLGRNPWFNANTFKYNTPSTGRRHIGSFALGNPIVKNKLFTFTSYEVWKWSPESSGLTSTQPTDLERVGDFSKSLTKDRKLRVIYDPLTTVFDPATNTATRTPFAGNVIPADRINKAAAALMQYMWKPNRAPDDPSGTNNFNAVEYRVERYWNFLNKTDWVVNEKLRTYVRFSKNSNWTRQNGAGTIAETNYWEGRSTGNVNVTGDVVYTLSPTVFLDVRASYADLNQLFPSPDITFPYDEWKDLFFGGSDWGRQYYDGAIGLRYPALNIGGKQGYGNNLGWMQYGTNYVVQPKLAMSHGRHYLKVGADYRKQFLTAGWPNGPGFDFGQEATASTFINPDLAETGDGYASFLLGGITGGSAPYLPALKPIESTFSVYFQDDLKLNSRVTLNVGLRVTRDPGPVEEQDRVLQYVDLNGSLPALSGANVALPQEVSQLRRELNLGDPIWKGGAHYADSSNRRLYNAPAQFEPRVGAAIRLNDQTSLRLAYARWAVPPILSLGALQMPTGISWGGGGMTAYGYYAQTNVQGFVEGKPTAFLDNPFPAGLLPATGNGLGLNTQLGDSITWNNQSYKPPVSDRFNVSIQRQLPGKVVADFTYLFHYGSNVQPASVDDGQTYMTDYNLIDPAIRAQLGSRLEVAVPNPFYNFLTPNDFPGNIRNYPTISVGQLLLPYPQYTGLMERGRSGFHNRYNSFQFKATRQMANGLQFIASYVHDKDEYQQFVGNTRDEFLNTPHYFARPDGRNRVNVATVFELPFGRGRRFGGNVNRIVDNILGGWDFGSIFMWRSGNMLALGDWDLTGESITVSNPNGQQWFNAGAFARKANPYSLRTAPVYVDGLVGPGFWNLDATLSKRIRMTERLGLELRLEAYNATNTWLQAYPNMSGPDDPQFGTIPATADPRTAARTVQYLVKFNF